VLLDATAFERELLAERIRAALSVKRARGELVGGIPYGYRFILGPERLRRDGVVRPVRLLLPDPRSRPRSPKPAASTCTVPRSARGIIPRSDGEMSSRLRAGGAWS
jgi:hypothetical protein